MILRFGEVEAPEGGRHHVTLFPLVSTVALVHFRPGLGLTTARSPNAPSRTRHSSASACRVCECGVGVPNQFNAHRHVVCSVISRARRQEMGGASADMDAAVGASGSRAYSHNCHALEAGTVEKSVLRNGSSLAESRPNIYARRDEGFRLIKAFTAIEDSTAREAVITFVEILALRSLSSGRPN